MPKTLEQGFAEFLTRLTPTASESSAAQTHRRSIEGCLKTNFGMTRFFRTGSFGNGTSISGYSDVDYFAEIPRVNLKRDSKLTLSEVRVALDTRFPRTGVRVSSPTILIPFGTNQSESTEVAPCDYMHDYRGFRVYEIADGNGGWLCSCPEIHNYYVRDVDNVHGGKVKKLIRLIKAWKYYNNVPISSFYLELQVTKYCQGESSIIYYFDIYEVLNKLLRNNLSSMRDPMEVSGLISACSSDAKWSDAMSKLKTAVVRAEKVRSAAMNDRTRDAFDCLNDLFADKFPSYY